jgi:hypothetical protein
MSIEFMACMAAFISYKLVMAYGGILSQTNSIGDSFISLL